LACLLRTYGFPPVVHLMPPSPSPFSPAFFRYADPTWSWPAVALAALGLDGIGRRATRWTALVVGSAITAVGGGGGPRPPRGRS